MLAKSGKTVRYNDAFVTQFFGANSQHSPALKHSILLSCDRAEAHAFWKNLSCLQQPR